MKILSLRVENFQAHELRKVQFSPEITTIRGPTDRGKSALLRALRWLCLNDMAGDAFVREGAKSTVVELHIATNTKSGMLIIARGRNRGAGGNFYRIGKEDADKLVAFGQSVPEEVRKVLALAEINFQGQHDSPFWLNETAGEVSRRLNAVIDLSVIDSSLMKVASEVRRSQERAQLIDEDLQATREAYKQQEKNKRRIAEFGRLAKQQKQLDHVAKNANRLADLLDRARDNKPQAHQAQAEQGRQVISRYQQLSKIRNCVQRLSRLLESSEKRIAAPPDFSPVVRLHDKRDTTIQQVAALSQLITGLEGAQARIASAYQVHRSLKDKISQVEICPTCKRPL